MNTADYLRQSQDRTGEELGITRQREDIRKLAGQRGLDLVLECADNDTSASGRRRRPGFEALLKAIEDGVVQCVVAWDMTRLTRNARDRLRLLELGKKHGLTVVFVRGSDLNLGTPAGRLTADILGSVAQHEIEQKSDRQRRASRQAAESGKRVGGRRPFGYEADGMTIRPVEAQALVEAYDAVLAGASLGGIARGWNEQGLLTPQASRDGAPSRWAATTIRATLLNPRYAGLRSHVTEEMLETLDPRRARLQGIIGTAAWEPLISENRWRAVVEMLMDPDRANLPRSGRALLTGIALCGVCGGPVHRGGAPARGDRPGHPTYRCRMFMGHVGRMSIPVDQYVSDLVVERLSRPDAVSLLVDESRADAVELRQEAQSIRTRLNQLAALFADGVLTETGVRQESARLRAKLAEVEQAQAASGRGEILRPIIGAADPQAAWDGLDTDRRRAVIDILMTVTLLPPGRGTRTFRPESVVISWKG